MNPKCVTIQMKAVEDQKTDTISFIVRYTVLQFSIFAKKQFKTSALESEKVQKEVNKTHYNEQEI